MRAELVARLRTAGCVYAEDEADLLLAADGDVDALVARRIAGEPLEHLLGWVAFGGLRIAVSAGVFVPRQRTMALVDAALSLAPHVLVDLCCGSGAVGAVVLDRSPGVEVHGADLDPRSVACAARNLPTVWEGDLFDALPRDLLGRVDVVVANAPYVPTGEIRLMPPEAREHEPAVALDGGVELHRRIAAGVRPWLAPGGHVLIETSVAQAPLTAAALEEQGLRVTVLHDEERDATVVSAT